MPRLSQLVHPAARTFAGWRRGWRQEGELLSSDHNLHPVAVVTAASCSSCRIGIGEDQLAHAACCQKMKAVGLLVASLSILQLSNYPAMAVRDMLRRPARLEGQSSKLGSWFRPPPPLRGRQVAGTSACVVFEVAACGLRRQSSAGRAAV